MKEIITLQIGQTGINLGNSLWELYGLEHGIDKEGVYQEIEPSNQLNNSNFYFECDGGKFEPRAVLIDIEPDVIDNVKLGDMRGLFNNQSYAAGNEMSALSFARAQSVVNNGLIDVGMDKIRIMSDKCESLDGFISIHSLGGGTGSGLTSLLLEKLSDDYGNKTKMTGSINPYAKMSPSIVEPYNSVLSINSLLEHSNITLMYENEAVHDIGQNSLEIERPDFENMNRVISRAFSGATRPLRNDSPYISSMSEIQSKFIPYPNVKFLIQSYAPFIPIYKRHHELPSLNEFTKSLNEPYTQLSKGIVDNGKYLATGIYFFGSVSPAAANAAFICYRYRRCIRIVDWSPCGLIFHMGRLGPISHEGNDIAEGPVYSSVISNSTSVRQLFSKIELKFDCMYEKRAFVHSYVNDGLEEGMFSDSRENIAALQKDYEEGEIEAEGEEEDFE